MRRMRVLAAIAALTVVTAACGDDDAATATTAGGTGTTVGGATTTQGSGSVPGGADGSIVFEITGGYERSGEFPIVPEASVFSNNGWSATFAGDDTDAIISVNLIEGNTAVIFGDGQAVITGGELLGCTFDISKNDSDGFAGTFSCNDIEGFTPAGALITVDFSGEFSY